MPQTEILVLAKKLMRLQAQEVNKSEALTKLREEIAGIKEAIRAASE